MAIWPENVNGKVKYAKSYYYFKYKLKNLIDRINTTSFLFHAGSFLHSDEESNEDLVSMEWNLNSLIEPQLEIDKRLQENSESIVPPVRHVRRNDVKKEKVETALYRLDYAPLFHGLKKANIFPMELRSIKIFSQLLVDLNITSSVPTTQQLFSDFNNRSESEKAKHVNNVIQQLKNTIHWLEVEFLEKKINKETRGEK